MKSVARKISTGLILAIFSFALVGCGGSDEADEILNYVNVDLVPILEKETTMIEAYESVSGENYSDDQTMYDTITGVVLPASTELVELSEKLTFTSEDLKSVHNIYISLVTTQLEAFTMVVEALEKQDADMITEANGLLEKTRELADEYGVKMQELLDTHGIEVE